MVVKEPLLLKKKNEALAKELAAKKNELKIEAALERVRRVAMSISDRADMLKVCKTISQQLEKLGVKDIRNVQTAIFYKERGTYMNYEYYAKHDKTVITETFYTDHKISNDFALKMMQGKGKFYITHIKGQKVKEWLKHQKKTNVFIDRYLEKATSLNYYWHSLGPVSLGISTYSPLNKDELSLFSRFLKVFELAYRRYLDIEKAETQANEAKIETSLEKVRAAAMGMYRPEDLLKVCNVLFKELRALGFDILRNAMINIHNDADKTFINYDYSDEIGSSTNHLAYNIHPLVEKQIKKVRSTNDAFSETFFTGRDLVTWRNFRKKIGEKDDPRLKKTSGLYYYFYSIGVGSIGISTFGAISEEKKALLKRFRNVFALAYQRYIDIAKAEAQAKEARIETALERVRAVAMAMKKSEELVAVSEVMYNELVSLGFTNIRNAQIAIENEEKQSFKTYVHSDTEKQTIKEAPYSSSPLLLKAKQQLSSSGAFYQAEYTGKELDDWRNWKKKMAGPLDKRELSATSLRWYLYATGKGHMGISTYNEIPAEQVAIVERFKNVFELSYQRFDDLQKAEAQAREARIETALERVRAVAMAMKTSDDLLSICEVLYKELVSLGFKGIRNALIDTFGEGKDHFDDYDYSDATGGSISYVPYNSHPIVEAFVKKVRSSPGLFSELVVDESELNSWKEYRKRNGQPADPRLNNCSSLYYYMYSIGISSIGISAFNPLSKDKVEVLERFANVFRLAYQRYTDISLAEAQAREAQIEAALERVRSRSMGMQKSEELKEVIQIVFEQLVHLNINAEHAGFVVDYKPKGDWHFWIADKNEIPSKITHPYFESVWANQFNEAKKKGAVLFTTHLNFEEKNKFYRELLSYVPGLPEESKKFYLSCPALAASTALAEDVSLYIENFSGIPYSDEENAILIRFGKVFQQTYTRFLDLQKAEAQAKEARIEAALERVRSRSMAMHKSDELLEAAEILFVEMQKLGIESLTAGYVLIDKEEKNGLNYTPNPSSKKILPLPIIIPHNETIHLQQVVENWKKGNPFFIVEMDEAETIKHQTFIADRSTNFPLSAAQLIAISPSKLFLHNFYFKEGYVLIVGGTKLSVEQTDIMLRFTKVFQQTYTRFLDLQKSEAQAKEAKIEAALERVRSRSLAMHHSSELSAVVDTLLREFTNLEFTLTFCIINLIDEQDRSNTVWAANPETGKDPESYYMKFEDYPFHHAMWDAWKEQKKNFIYTIEGKEKKIYDEYLYNRTEFRRFPKHVQEANKALKRYVAGFTFFKYSGLQTVSENHISNEELAILERFGRVFEQSYTRFLDLQKAEAQAKEAHIEAALERVRSRAMAMQSSEELNALIGSVFTELTKLDLVLTRCAILIYEDNENEKGSRQWMINAETPSEPMSLYMKYSGLPYFKAIRKAWNDRLSKWQYVLEGKDKFVTDEFLFKETDLGLLPGIVIDAMRAPEKVYISASFNNFGCIILASIDPLAAEHFDILQRFSKVFDLTYTRFNDLKQAEAQAREARIEAALEKVRSRSLAMHKSDEIKEVVKTALEKIQELNIEMNGGVSLVTFSPGSKDLTHWLWIPEQLDDVFKAYLPYFDHIMFRDCDGAREQGVELIAKVYSGKEKETYFDHLFHHTDFSAGPESVKDWVVQQPYFGFSYAIQKHSGIFLNDYTGKFFTKETNDILVRFSKVFEQAYVRFLDLQKAEAQTRESQIQLALERARAQSMMMQRSTELDDTLRVFHEQVLLLNIPSAFSFLWLPDEEKDRHIFWAAWEEEQQNSSTVFKSKAINYALDRNEPATKQCLIDWKSDEPVVSYAVPPEGVKNYFAAWQELIDGVEKLKPEHFRGGLYYIEAFMKYGCFGVMVEKELPEDEKKILLRFAIEFERTYTRFLDLQKAELQAREAEIELALERIRAKTMAMQDPAEFVEVVKIIGEQFLHLGFDIEWANFDAGGEDIAKGIDTWNFAVMPGGDHIASRLFIPYFDHPLFTDAKKLLDKYRSTGEDFFEMTYPKEIKDSWLDHMFTKTIFKDAPKEYRDIQYAKPGYTTSNLVLKDAWLSIGKFDAISFTAEQHAVLKRFGKAFGQANTRFLDLQKAEAQAREAQIEAALERVRAKTMGMHNSIDLLQVNIVLSEQLLQLGFRADAASFITDVDEKGYNMWLAKPGDSFLSKVYIPRTDNKITSLFTEALEKGSDFYTYTLTKEEKNIYFKNFFENSALKNYPEDQKQQVYNAPGLAATVVIMNKIFLSVSNFSAIPYSDQENMIIKRFAFVFQQSYTRFLDLQKAEAQAREAQIEASLERVRSKAMAMQKSEDLADAVCIVFEELDKLNLDMLRCGIGIVNKEKRCARVWTTTVSDNNTIAQVSGDESMDIHPLLVGTFEAWLKQEDFNYVLKGEDLRNYYKALVKVDFRLPDSQSLVAGEDERVQYFYSAIFPSGGLFVFSESELRPEAKTILRRFADVFNLTYTRFLDIQNAEAQAREAKIETALERVRSRALAMQEPEELKEVAQVMRNEMGALGVEELETSSIYIHGDSSENVECWYALQDPKHTEKKMVADHFILDLTATWVGREMKKFYLSNEKQTSIVMQGINRREWIEYCYTHSPVFTNFYGETIPDRTYHLYRFSHGYIGAAAPGDISAESWRLLSRAASVFSLAYSRFRDLTQALNDLIKLKEEKKRAEDALTELQSAQRQLVQSEKMASLGELTAGIAHEIQNPLNFVNNFSEVSKELLDEMKSELDSGNIEDAKEIMADVIQNLEKINHHGKRADGIVKGMLQHSRSSSGVKEPTDINALCDEYLRLSYHGLRAKDKTFNAKFETDLDNGIGKINIIPQEIGRVILNLINNAFYAVTERRKKNEPGYEPIVKVTSKKVDETVEIRVTDNGTGIPQQAIDKIFQPFFTTKPTGQGTGLGLSLSYDIITKGHGGELKVETKEGEGTEFIIQLPVV